MQVTLYNINDGKRHCGFAPSGSDIAWTIDNVYSREPFDILDPVFRIDTTNKPSGVSVEECDVLKVDATNRFYKITKMIETRQNEVEIYCHHDVARNWAPLDGVEREVVRTTATGYKAADGMYIDSGVIFSDLPTRTTVQGNTKYIPTISGFKYTGGTYSVSIGGPWYIASFLVSYTGGASYMETWAISELNMESIRDYVIRKKLNNQDVSDLIVGAYKTPFSFTNAGGTPEEIRIGTEAINVYGLKINAYGSTRVANIEYSMQFPIYQSGELQFMTLSAYYAQKYEVRLYTPFTGQYTLAKQISNKNHKVTVHLDIVTGEYSAEIHAITGSGYDEILSIISGNAYSTDEMLLGSYANNLSLSSKMDVIKPVLSTAISVAGTAASVATGNAVGAVIAGLSAGQNVLSLADSLVTSVPELYNSNTVSIGGVGTGEPMRNIITKNSARGFMTAEWFDPISDRRDCIGHNGDRSYVTPNDINQYHDGSVFCVFDPDSNPLDIPAPTVQERNEYRQMLKEGIWL